MLRTAGQFPPPADDWLLQLDAAGARLLASDHTVVYAGPLDRPTSWQQLARQAGACVVLIGTVGLYADQDDELTPAELRQLLHQAARAGELAGAVVQTQNAS
jgi:hypothetical protein